MSIVVKIEKKYQDFTLNLSFDSKGKPMGFLGASGCGKSMTLSCIAGIMTPDAGRIILNDRVLYDSSCGINLPPQQRKIGMLFQNYALFPNMTVRDNIGIGIRNKRRRKESIDELLSVFRLETLQDRFPGQLSGGEQQRTAMARLLAYEPEALLLDEPFSALDAYLKEELQQELAGILRNYDREFLMVSHSTEELYRFCDTIAVIEDGRLLECGSRISIFEQPAYHRTAKLTGIRNLSRAIRRSDYEVEAIDWRLCLKTDDVVPEEIRYVGIRPEAIRDCETDGDNAIAVDFSHSIGGPQEVSLVFRSRNLPDNSHFLYWTISRQEWRKRKQELPGHLLLPKEHILLLK